MTSSRIPEFIERLTALATQQGDKIAASDEGSALSYRQLEEATDHLGQSLRSVGVGLGDRVAVVAENSANYLTTVIGIWKADATPVTIYPSTSEEDLRMTLDDADPVLVFADERTYGLTQASVDEGLPVRQMAVPGGLARKSGARKSPEELIGELALICYSSGTTSRPKAIMLSAHALANTFKGFSGAWRLGPGDVTLVSLPMAWLFGLTTASMSTLYAGGTVVSRKRARPEIIAEAIENDGVTVIPAVTTVLTKLANFLEDSERDWDLGSLRFIVSGGEPRNEQSFAKLRQFTSIPVHDNYCASEMQPLVTYDPISDPEPRSGSAGRLVSGSELKILDEHGNPVPVGSVGEGFSRGPGIMLGYWNDPDATSQALTEDGWYRTSDLLMMDQEGYVHVVGRASDMIIRGGSNISPSEVEQRIRQHPSVADVAVVGQPDALYGEEVVAVVVLKSGASLNREEVQAFAASGLAGFKVPTRFIHVNELPVNQTTGKVNRKTVKHMLEEGTLA